jgi:hypothetical protein
MSEEGHNRQQSRPVGDGMMPGMLIADFERSRSKPQPPAKSLIDEIVDLVKAKGGCKLSALRLIRECAENPLLMGRIPDDQLRNLIVRQIKRGRLL